MAVWQDCCRRIQKLSLTESDGLGSIRQLQDKLDEKEFEEVLTINRLIWHRINSYVFGRKFVPPHQMITKARELMGDYQVVTHEENSVVGVLMSSPPRWTRPPVG